MATLKPGSEFCSSIPTTATSVIFTNIVAPSGATTTDISVEQDGSIVSWLDETTYYVSTQVEGNIIYANVDCDGMFKDCSTLTNIDFGNFNTSNVTNMHCMFQECSGLTELNISDWDTSNVTNMVALFVGCTSLTELDLSNWDFSNVTSTHRMFGATSSAYTMSFTNIQFPSKTNFVKLTNATEMFLNCINLVSLDVSNWDVSNVTRMKSMFKGCSVLTELDVSNWNTSNVTTMAGMFKGCESLTTLDVSNWDTSNVTTMSFMFEKCFALAALDVSNWDVSSVTDMSCMFQMETYGDRPTALKELDVSKWNTSNVTDMSFMFYGLHLVKLLDVSNWDVSKVTDFDHLFAHSYITVTDISSWKNSIATNLSCAFYSLQNEVLDVSGFETGNSIVFDKMFKHCSKLRRIIGLEKFNTSNAYSFGGMFDYSGMIELDLSSFDTTKADDTTIFENNYSSEGGTGSVCKDMFANMPNLRKIKLGEKFSFNGDGTTTNIENIAVLPTPDFKGADGKWYNSDGESFTPEDIPSLTAGTYYAMSPKLQTTIKYQTMVDIGESIRKISESPSNYLPSKIDEAIYNEYNKILGGAS